MRPGQGNYTNNPFDLLDSDDLLTLEDWTDYSISGVLIDYDGYGHPVKGGLEDTSIIVLPSTELSNVPTDATHIAWYNR